MLSLGGRREKNSWVTPTGQRLGIVYLVRRKKSCSQLFNKKSVVPPAATAPYVHTI